MGPRLSLGPGCARVELVDLERAASIVEIQQLGIGYVVGIDRRDVDMIAALFVPDVDCGHWGTGPEAFRKMYLENDSTFGTSIHQATNHLVEYRG